MKKFNSVPGLNGGMRETEYGEYVLLVDHQEREAVLQKNHAVLLAHYHVAAQVHTEETKKLQRQLADAQALIVELEGDPDSDQDNIWWLPKYARYAIEDYRKKYPK